MQDYYFDNNVKQAENYSKTPILLRTDQITVPQTAPKRAKSPNATIRLAASIQKYGVLEPLSVKVRYDRAGAPVYELIKGEHRLRAAILAGIEKVPCVLLADTDKNCAISDILSSLQHKSLHMFEQAAAFRLLMEDFGLTQESIARKIGVSQSAVANKLRLLQLSKEEQQQILALHLTERHARTLLRLKSRQERAAALRRIGADGLNVAATESLIEQMTHPEPKSISKTAVSVTVSPEMPPKGILPRKFAIPDLTPLYNSIERTLSIFRKTGAVATCKREESTDGVRIIIEVPKNA